MNVSPSSSAVWIVAMDWSQSAAPYHSLIPMQPRPWAETARSPSLVVRIPVLLASVPVPAFADTARIGVNLRVEQLEAFPLGRDRPAYSLPVTPEELKALSFARPGPHQLRGLAGAPSRHDCEPKSWSALSRKRQSA